MKINKKSSCSERENIQIQEQKYFRVYRKLISAASSDGNLPLLPRRTFQAGYTSE